MKKCMGSIIYVPGCDGSNNHTSKKYAPKETQATQNWLDSGGGEYYGRGGVTWCVMSEGSLHVIFNSVREETHHVLPDS